ncbi:MAG: hypothetical protein EXR62_12905 [Chloroflexi bacterium]|nr:hypothetical protein [Chloroflexota bacterium]
MAEKEMGDIILRWFQIARVGGLVLPDGWFGRPYDNTHQLTHLEIWSHKLLIELDDQLLLIFTDIKKVRIENSELLLTDFVQLVFDYQEYVNLSPHARVYKDGEVRLIPLGGPPGQ